MKKKLMFPTAFTVLFIVLILAAGLTYLVNAGAYAKLVYDLDNQVFIETFPDGTTRELEGTQKTLDELGVSSDIAKFQEGSINKPIAVPGTYEKVKANPQGIRELLLAPIQGVYDSIGIILFVFIIGGVIGIINESGAINAGIAALSRVTKGHEYMLIVFVTFLVALGGTTFGLAEETIAFYPILMPVYLAAGYDAIVCIAAIYMGSSIGSMFSTTNPFSVVIGSNAAGINFTQGVSFRLIGLAVGFIITTLYIVRYANRISKNPEKSLVYDLSDEMNAHFKKESKEVEFTPRRIMILIIFILSFVVMIYGVANLGWWFEEMTALFLVSGVIIGIFAGMGEKIFVNTFIAGAADLMGVGLVIGIARSINIILENGLVSDTILYGLSTMVSGMNRNIFVILMMFVFMILGFFIASSSGLATLAIPIMAPLADAVNVPRDVIITACIFGQGLMSFITPTGLILASLEMVHVTYNKWLRFVLPLLALITILAIFILLLEINI
ncbi:MAG: YfcC family protein [Clostridiales bacterium]|nr:YfcC family protein [uncultured Anaerosporobacter sp.]MBS5932716.1 YfcC family protein [Clostridiales bacterium]